MCDYYEEPEEETGFVGTIKQLVEDEVNQRVGQLSQDYADLDEKYWKLIHENAELQRKLDKFTQNEIASDFVAHSFLTNLNENNLGQYLSMVLQKSHVCYDYMGDPPSWFVNLVEFYDCKNIVFGLLDFADAKYPIWAKNIVMPYEWSEDQLDLFFDTMRNHYVCNGQIYERNIGFWYREWAMNQFDVERCLKHNYSQTPWQFVLRNPLLNSEKCAKKIARAINDNNHGLYFCRIENYQKLDDSVKKALFNDLSAKVEMNREDFNALIVPNLQYLNDAWKEKYYQVIVAKESKNDYGQFFPMLSKLPREFSVRFLNENKENLFPYLAKIVGWTQQEKIDYIKGLP